jgi:hypothetical protein
MWNVATDLAINSIIVSGENKNATLPKGGLIPGVFPTAPDDDKPLTKEQKDAMPMASLIESFPHSQASEWYFDRLKQKAEQVQQQMQQSCPRHGKGNPRIIQIIRIRETRPEIKRINRRAPRRIKTTVKVATTTIRMQPLAPVVRIGWTRWTTTLAGNKSQKNFARR